MKIGNRSAALACLVGALSLGTALPTWADDVWEVTSKMEMPGMPMAMPAQVHRVCTAKNRKDEDLVPKQGDCRMVDSKRTGNTFTYRMECSGTHASTVDGTMTFGNNGYDGKMHMAMKGSGDAMDMTF